MQSTVKAPVIGTIGIRREDKNRWERRTPLAPKNVAALVAKGLRVLVQPSNLRIFSDEQYEAAGAIVTEDISEANIIVAVKIVPAHLLIENHNYIFFSHTIKAQPENMPLLDAVLEKKVRLFDHERIVDENNRRLVRFGLHAGITGTIDFLHCLADRLLSMQISTPLLHLGISYIYDSVAHAKEAVTFVKDMIVNRGGLPAAICPMIFMVTGTGNVAKGVLEILELLPYKKISPEEVKALSEAEVTYEMRHTVYYCVATSADYIEPNDPSKKFDRQDYYNNPHLYHSTFAEKFAPYVSVIVNAIYWDARFPRLITTNQWKDIVENKNPRLLGIADISCDVDGSIEFMKKATSIDHPTFLYDVKTDRVIDDIYGPGVMIMAIDHLPSELPREASELFGNNLVPFMENLANARHDLPLDESNLAPEVYRACIATHGALTPSYEYIRAVRAENEKAWKRILLLGSGLVAPALVNYLLKFKDNHITIASMFLKDALKLAAGRDNLTVCELNVADEEKLSTLVSKHDIVVSFVPYNLHGYVARSCLRYNVNMVTASYVQPDLRELEEEAKQKGVILLNEVGLDPGIDHISIMKTVQELKRKGGKIYSLQSNTGGLPAPEASNNPFGYKISWSPRGVLNAGLNAATFRINGEVKSVPGNALFESAESFEVYPAFALEVLPNRNSLAYGELYGLPDLETMFRGTLRFKGYSSLMAACRNFGLFNSEQQTYLAKDTPSLTWSELTAKLAGAPDLDVQSAVCKKLQLDPKSDFGDKVLHAFEW
eukprot:TRINITY_DN1265_c0_g1_i2.p1 TRINITY_DN1265_c0_g1~~TRINITY_DN1265_c0_g1_i2.p1  ORF type:complete len:774 (-),score=163.53 TRINITY_DN1265_c0_g1_i2:285-2606(-)